MSRHRIILCERCDGEMWFPNYERPRPWICGLCIKDQEVVSCESCGFSTYNWALIEHYGRQVCETCKALDPLGQGSNQ